MSVVPPAAVWWCQLHIERLTVTVEAFCLVLVLTWGLTYVLR